MDLHEEFDFVGDWFRIHFLENKGMAFGLSIPGAFGKYILTFFRIAVVIGLIYYLFFLLKRKASNVAIVSMALITSGALGNIIDSVFYGVIYADINHYTGSWFEGRVVDMLYFPLLSGYFPNWLPFWGGEYFEFFRPIFNLADTSISTGVALIFLFQKHFIIDKNHEALQESVIDPADSDVDY